MSTPSTESTSSSLFAPDVEGNSIALLLKHPDAWGEFYLNDREDYSPVHRPIWDHIKIALDSSPQGSVDPLLLSERMKANGIAQLLGGGVPYDYISGLKDSRSVEKVQASFYAKELKRLRVRRELIVKLDTARRELLGKANYSFEEMTSLVEQALSTITTDYHKPDVYEVLGERIIETVEKRADNPVDPSDMLYQGPFASINKTLGPLIFPGSLTTIIARTGQGKSTFAFFYCVWVAEKYKLPLLWLDAAEMTVEQLQMRAVCCFSEGRIPLWAVRSGEWRKNPAWSKIIRNEIWPRVRAIEMHYKNVGSMSPKEKVSFIRRFYYNKVGRSRFLIVGDDYLKGVEALGKNSQEYQAMGYYIQAVKTLISDEIDAGYWTSIQGNRSIISSGKKLSEINDSGEQGASLSDRIIQQSTNGLLLRFKVTEELAAEKNLFGNTVLKKAKLREGYGKDYEKFVRPIRLDSGAFVENYFHLDNKSFFYLDKGLHSDALQILGKTTADLSKGEGGSMSGL